MAEILKERSELDPAFQWDLSSLYKTDEDWESALMTLEDRIQQAASYQGKLTDAPTIREFMDLDTQLDRLLSDLFCYANLRRSEDTRGETAQSMYARIYSKYVAAVSQTAFAVPEILSLPAGELEAIHPPEGSYPVRGGGAAAGTLRRGLCRSGRNRRQSAGRRPSFRSGHGQRGAGA